MCSPPEFDDEMLPLSKGDALEGATLCEGYICGEQQFHRTHGTHKTLLRSIL